MSATSWLLIPFLLTLPLAVSWRRRNRSALARELWRRLAMWTAAALGLMLLLAGIDAVGGFAWWYELPSVMTFHRPPAELTWITTFWLWQMASRVLHDDARPAAPATDPRPGTPVAAVRAASLTSRRALSPLPGWSWSLLWLPWLVAAVWLTVAWTDTPTRTRLVVLLVLGAQVPGLLVAMWTPRLALREPEPLDPSGRDDLAATWSRYRSRRLVGLFVMMVVMSCAFSGVAVCVLSAAFDEPGLGLLGGIGGSLLGLAGAAFGVWNGLERLRIQRRVERGALRADAAERSGAE